MRGGRPGEGGRGGGHRRVRIGGHDAPGYAARRGQPDGAGATRGYVRCRRGGHGGVPRVARPGPARGGGVPYERVRGVAGDYYRRVRRRGRAKRGANKPRKLRKGGGFIKYIKSDVIFYFYFYFYYYLLNYIIKNIN